MTTTRKKETKIEFFKGLEEFKKTIPEGKRKEWCSFVTKRWDVVKAKFFIKKKGLKPDTLNVSAYAASLGLDKPKGVDCNNMFCAIDNDYAENAELNLDDPVILIRFVAGKGKDKRTHTGVLDGRHRIRRAFLEGREEIPCYVIHEKYEPWIEF